MEGRPCFYGTGSRFTESSPYSVAPAGLIQPGILLAKMGDEELAHLHFYDFSLRAMPDLWPGGKGGACKKHRREKNFPGSPHCASAG